MFSQQMGRRSTSKLVAATCCSSVFGTYDSKLYLLGHATLADISAPIVPSACHQGTSAFLYIGRGVDFVDRFEEYVSFCKIQFSELRRKEVYKRKGETADWYRQQKFGMQAFRFNDESWL